LRLTREAEERKKRFENVCGPSEICNIFACAWRRCV
jgi:hypothetical protein